MRITVVDETLALAQSARRVFLSSDIKAAYAGSLDELPLLFEANGVPDLLIVNVVGKTTGGEIATHIQATGYRERLLAFVDTLADPRARGLAQVPHAECIVRPPSEDLLDKTLRTALLSSPRPSSRRLAALPEPARPAFHGIVGRSPKMLEVFSRIEKVASGDANVCIYGESGTGKELIARAIHYLSRRADRPLITLDCTTIPDGLMESHLLGHVRGAFTGAVEQREGVFRLAHTGTLFIDELCELNLPLQAKLLRVIQNREFMRVGGTKPIRTDIRLVTAANKDPKHEVERGTFREDLYYRVAVFMINVPPLRERKEDIPLLAEHFLKKFSATYGKPLDGIEPRAMSRMVAARWPGNIRQLENFVEQAVVLAEGRSLTERDLFAGEAVEHRTASGLSGTYEPGLPLREVERRYIFRTLQKVNGNRIEAARLLQISVRGLQYKLKEYAGNSHLSGDQAF